MPICCVFKCSERQGHIFPKDLTLRKLWVNAVKRKNWTPTTTSIVCRAHFLSSDYITESYYSGYQVKRRTLKANVVPTVFHWLKDAADKRSESCNARIMRQKKRLSRTTDDQQLNRQQSDHQLQEGFITVNECDVAEEVAYTSRHEDNIVTPNPLVDKASQTVSEGPRFQILAYRNNPTAIHFYTGLKNYAKFCFVLQTLGPAAYQLNYANSQVMILSVENQFFLSLIKLRLNKQLLELSLLFEISESTVSNIFKTWVSFMALQWGELNIWPSTELVQYFMPRDFKLKFPQTRVIMDGTEFPIGKPKEPNFQQVTFSTYKNRNTLKVLVGVTPGGLISYCSDAYGGSASDRQIVERSQFLNMCSPGNSIMADRGFNVQDIFAPKDIQINIPSFLKGASQLPGLTVVHDRKIASKRVHVERIIGMTKTYKILKQELNSNFVHLGTHLFFICAMLCNFREGIVGKDA